MTDTPSTIDEEKLVARSALWAAREAVNNGKKIIPDAYGVAWAKTVRMRELTKKEYIQEVANNISTDGTSKLFAFLAYKAAGYPGETKADRAYLKMRDVAMPGFSGMTEAGRKAIGLGGATTFVVKVEPKQLTGDAQALTSDTINQMMAAPDENMRENIIHHAAGYAAKGQITLKNKDGNDIAWARLARENMGNRRYTKKLREMIGNDPDLMAQAELEHLKRYQESLKRRNDKPSKRDDGPAK